MEHENSHDDVQIVRGSIYLGDKWSTVERREIAATKRTRCGWVKSRKCGELLHGRRFPFKLKEADHKSYARRTITYGIEGENEMEILWRKEIHGERNLWSTAQR